MGLLELDIKDLRKKALIKFSLKPEGHVFGVHRLTGGDELKLGELSRKANRLILRLEKVHAAEQFDENELKKITKEIESLEDERLKVKASVFDDGLDGSLSKALILELNDSEVGRLVRAVENDESIVPKSEKSDGEAA